MSDLVLSRTWPATDTPAPTRRTPWLRDALRAEPDDGRSPHLLDEVRCDVLVVGGGFTGLWTALEILRRAPGTDIVLIEADVCGGGASGANAGYLMPMWARFSSLVAIGGYEEARRLGEASAEAVDDILDFADTHGIDIEHRRGPWMWAASSPAQHGAWRQTLADLARAGTEPLHEVSAAESRRAVGTRNHFGAVLDPGCATLQPAKLTRGMRRVALDAGVRVHERTPLTALRNAPGRTTVAHTPYGRVHADRVVLAVNAWAGQLEDLGRRMVTVASDTVLTEPVADRLAAIGWQDATSVCDSRRRLNYYRTTPDGRLLFGKGGSGVAFGKSGPDTLWGGALRRRELERQLARLFPELADAPVDAAWTAPVEYSTTSLPFAGWLRTVPGVCYATGYSGDGVGPSRLMAKVLASLVLGTDDEWARSAFTRPPGGWIPPEPVRYPGARVVMPALRAVEYREDRGRGVPALVKRLASIDPSDFRR
ncbi:NAD(P)/FAD-dependent oxidoreductase [Streptomyces sp. NPDC054949]|uniref:NAD(P)/FAD-dependent oxidoreductase n=1 Tax=unclassified Streptomyces TaxID=2593676 RepID=UPI002256B790|nr:FAD-binding oxidoreductase [Streptomyces sp. NBC_00424]MCX5072891.1 FAD-binding oxidoreductase [Streptomyces sp. NBC_00424]WUD43811.1 FAD-binding oxidoreductase [Streptomyces sp. NBC_00513]